MIVVGVGCRRDAEPAAVRVAVDAALESAGLRPADVAALATVDRRAAEPGPRELAASRGWRLAALTAGELAARSVPNPSVAVAAALGTASVAEAAALCTAGPDSTLLVPKRVVGGVTVAVARKLVEQGRIDPDGSTVLCITGNGLKTQEALINRIARPVVIKPNLEDFEALVGSPANATAEAGAELVPAGA